MLPAAKTLVTHMPEMLSSEVATCNIHGKVNRFFKSPILLAADQERTRVIKATRNA